LERLKSRQQHNKGKETREGLDEFGGRNIFKKFYVKEIYTPWELLKMKKARPSEV
jgi:hypothetical protein